MNRLLLVRHAPTASTRQARFPTTCGARAVDGCEPLDRAGAAQAATLAPVLPQADHCWASFAVRTRQTAQQAGCEPEPYADLAECDFGRWAGLMPAQVADTDALAAWYADPDSAPHGGECFADVCTRAAKVLLRAREAGGTVIAFTHGGLVRAAVIEALGLGAGARWRLEAAPASVAELHPAGEGWRAVRLNWTPGGWRSEGWRSGRPR